MKRYSIFLAGFSLVLIHAQISYAQDADYVEPGRFGVEGTIGNGSFQTGLVREADQYEIALDADGSTSNSAGVNSGDLGLEFRAGKRFNIGSFNYLSAGIDAQTALFQLTNGTASPGSYTVGPYIGLQRHFSGTNLMLTLYVLPYSFTHVSSFGGNDSVNTHQFFQQGAFGIAYLF